MSDIVFCLLIAGVLTAISYPILRRWRAKSGNDSIFGLGGFLKSDNPEDGSMKVEYLGGNPEWRNPGVSRMSVRNSDILIIKGRDELVIPEEDVIKITPVKSGHYSLRKILLSPVKWFLGGLCLIFLLSLAAYTFNNHTEEHDVFTYIPIIELILYVSVIIGIVRGFMRVDTSEIQIMYRYNGRPLTIYLRSGKETDRCYSLLNSVYAHGSFI